MMKGFIDSLTPKRSIKAEWLENATFRCVINEILLKQRRNESDALYNAYESAKYTTSPATSRLLLLQGESGSGKSTLAESIRSTVEAEGGYFINGSFVQNTLDPFSVYRQVLSTFYISALCRGNDEIERIKSLTTAIPQDQRETLLSLVPQINELLGESHDNESPQKHDIFKNDEDPMTFVAVLECFFGLIASPDNCPLVIFLDDMQWAKEFALDILVGIMRSEGIKGCFVMAAVIPRPRPSVALEKAYADLTHFDGSYTLVDLPGLSEEAVKIVILEMFRMNEEELDGFAIAAYNWSRGNAFFLMDFLFFVVDESMLYFDKSNEYWMYNLSGLDLSPFEMVFSALSLGAREKLRQFVVLGSSLEPEIFQLLIDTEQSQKEFDELVDNGLVIVKDCGTRSLVHNCIQDQLLEAMSPDQISCLQYRTGKAFWKSLNISQLDRWIFLLAEQLVAGAGYIKKEKERIAVAGVCLRAGIHAVQSSSFQTAYLFLSSGISLLDSESWNTDYALCLDLYSIAAEIAYCSGCVGDVQALVDEVQLNSRNSIDCLRIQATQIYTLGSMNHIDDAVRIGLEILRKFGVVIPRSPSKIQIKLSVLNLKRSLFRISDNTILNLPILKDPTLLGVLQILNCLALYAATGLVELLPLILERIISATLKHGMSAVSSLGFTCYGMYLCWVSKDFVSGYRFGKLGLEIQKQFRSKTWLGRVATVFFATIHPYKNRLEDSIEPIQKAQRLLWSSGDVEFALLNHNVFFDVLIDQRTIPYLVKMYRKSRELMRLHGQRAGLQMNKTSMAALLTFSGETGGDFCYLRRDCFEEDGSENVYGILRCWASYAHMWTHYIFGNYDMAYYHSKAAYPLTKVTAAAGDPSVIILFDAMTALAYARNRRLRFPYLLRAHRALKELRRWSQHAPDNYQGKVFLLEAEIAALGRDRRAYPLYVTAITLLKEAGYFMHLALAYERLGKFLVQLGDEDMAIEYFEKSLERYKAWGGLAKSRHLENEIRNLGISVELPITKR